MTDLSGQPGSGQEACCPGIMGAETAHEFANLLTVVLGSLEQLSRQPLDKQGQQQLSRAEWSALQAARLTRQALSQAQGTEHVAAVVDLNAVVDGLVTIMDSRTNASVVIATDLALGPLSLCLDAGLLNLVLLNLIRDAVAAMPGGGEVVVRTRGPRLDGLGDQLTAEVSVSHNGTGVPADVAWHATDALVNTKQNSRGSNLGSWMAHSFTAQCGGKVKIETAPGQGTTVRLVFPYVGEAAPVSQ